MRQDKIADPELIEKLKKEKAQKEMEKKRYNIGKKPWFVQRSTVKPQD